MRGTPTWSVLALLTACEAHISDAPQDGGKTGDGAVASDAVTLGPWSTPAQVAPAATPEVEDDVTLSSNALEMIFAVDGPDGKDLYYTSRSSTVAPWTPAAPLSINGPATSEETPRLSADDKTLYFATDRDGDGNLDIHGVIRPAPGSMEWGSARPLSGVNTTTLDEKWFMPCAGDRYVMVQSAKTGTDLVEGTLGGDPPAPISALNTDSTETGAFLTRDCLTLYFASTRTMPERIYTSRRDSVGSPWQPPTVMTDFEALRGDQEDPWLSPDGRTFAFASNKDIYLSTR